MSFNFQFLIIKNKKQIFYFQHKNILYILTQNTLMHWLFGRQSQKFSLGLNYCFHLNKFKGLVFVNGGRGDGGGLAHTTW